MCNFILSNKREGGEWRLIMNELTLSPKCQLCKMLHHHKLWGESVMLRPGSGSGPGSHYVAGVRRGGGVTWYPARWKHLETSKVTVPLSSTQDQLQHSATTRLMRLDGTQRIFSISDNGPLYCQFHFLFWFDFSTVKFQMLPVEIWNLEDWTQIYGVVHCTKLFVNIE